MKKSLMRIAGALLTAAAIFFASCSDGVKYSSQIDTVMTLEKPQVQVAVYPGLNYVSWKAVPGATSYVVYVYEDGAERYTTSTVAKAYTATNYADTTLLSGHKYQYEVEAISKTNPSGSRAVYVQNSKGKSSEVTAIVPLAGTPAIDLTDFDTTDKNKAFVVTPAAINASTSKGYIRMSMPTKAYLQYVPYIKNELYLNREDANTQAGATLSSAGVYTTASTYYRPSANNVNPTNFAIAATVPGTYSVGVRVYAATGNSNIYPMSDIVAEKKVEVKGITVKRGTGDLYYEWITSTKARVCWMPAILNDNTLPKTTDYKVYTYNATTSTLTPVEVEVKDSLIDNINDIYYFDASPVEDTTYVVAYTLSDGEDLYVETRSSANKVTVNLISADYATAPVSGEISMIDVDEDNIANDAVLTLQLAEGTTLKSVKYAITDWNSTVDALFESANDFTAVSFEEGEIYYEITVAKDVPAGKYVAVMFTIAEEGCEDLVDGYVSATASGVSSKVAAAPVTSIALVAADEDNKVNDVKVSIFLAEETSIKSIVYATSTKSADVARKLLDNNKDVTAVPYDNGHLYNVITISDIDEGAYVAVKVVVEQDNCKDKVVTLNTTTPVDTLESAEDFAVIFGDFIDADDDGSENDYELFFFLNGDQTLESMKVATSPVSDEEALKLTYSKSAVEVANKKEVVYDYGEYGAYCRILVSDVEVDNFVGFLYTITEGEDKTPFVSEYVSDTVSGVFVETKTANPIINNSDNNFDDTYEYSIVNYDLNANDVQNSFTVEIGFKQNIKSIKYAISDDPDEAINAIEVGKEDGVLNIPTVYELKATADSPTVLTKVYTVTPDIKDVADGMYFAAVVEIVEEGYLNSYGGIVSANPAKQLEVSLPTISVGDAYNYEYIDVSIVDEYSYDLAENYIYTIEWTKEKDYEENAPVWLPISNLATKEIYLEGNGYTNSYSRRFKDIDVGSYVVRVAKTRKASVSVTGEEEVVFKDFKIRVVDIPCTEVDILATSSYERLTVELEEYISADYDDLLNYTYKLYEYEITGYDLDLYNGMTSDEKEAYINTISYDDWTTLDTITWVEDPIVSEMITNDNLTFGITNPTVKYYKYSIVDNKPALGTFVYKVTKVRTTPAASSYAYLATESYDETVATRIPNIIDDYEFSTANFEDFTVTIFDVFDPTCEDGTYFNYELEYVTTTDWDPIYGWYSDNVTTVVIPTTPEIDVYNNTYGVYGSITVSVTPDDYKTRLVKTRKNPIVSDYESGKVCVVDTGVVKVAYHARASVNTDTANQLSISLSDKINTQVDSASLWSYVVTYRTIWNDSIDETVNVYPTLVSTEDGVETYELVDDVYPVAITEDTEFYVEITKGKIDGSIAEVILTENVTVIYE